MNDTFLYVFVGFVAFTLILRPLLRRHEARRADRRGAVLSAQANAAGLRHELVTDDRAHPGVGVGTHLFSGTTDGLEWSAAVEVTLGDDGQPSRRSVGQRTRLFFPSLTAAPGRFVLAMSLPEGVQAPRAPDGADGGMLGRLAERAAEEVLDRYVDGYFGPEHRALVNAAGAKRPSGPSDLFVLCTDEPLAARLLDEAGSHRLAALRETVAGLGRPLESFGLLVSPSGLVVGYQVSLHDASVLALVAERVARLVAHARTGS
ncbi:MAG: hypothetical protein U0230_10500 [Polyangiales bacterium]